MVGIDSFIFGFRRIKIMPEDLSLVTSILIRNRLQSRIDSDGYIIVRERDFAKILELLSGRIEFTYSEPMGFPGMLCRIKHKVAIASSLCFSFLLCMFFGGIVWDVRVEGNSTITDGEVVLGLSDAGFEIGDFWRRTNLDEVEARLLGNNEKLAWVNINRRGTVAYVKVIEKEPENNAPDVIVSGYSNIIASTDCVIEEITVKRGVAVVKVGDTVKKGDLLVIGMLLEESGGGFCYAEASVIGRVSDSVSVEIQRNIVEKSSSDKKLVEIDVKFLKFSANILKSYRNLTKECDIIEDEKAYTLFGKCKLPFSITRKYIIRETSREICLSDDQLVKLANARLSSVMTSLLCDADLLSAKTSGKFTDDGYFLQSEIIFLSEVGVSQKFDVE